MTLPSSVFHLALRDVHAAAGAKFAVRQGWTLPADYGQPSAEYEAVRSNAGAFDRSNRSRFLVTGTDALDVLRGSFAGHVEDLDEGRAMRTLSLDESGHIEDLALIARTGGISYLVSGEPAQRMATFQRLRAAIGQDFDARVDDRTESTCLVALAGPRAAEVAREHLSEALPSRLQMLHCVTFEFHGFRTLAMRTSDSGEDGFEFMVAPAVAQHILQTLAEAGVRLIGADALDVLRVEAAIPAFVPDLEPGLSPGEAELDALLDVPGGDGGRVLAALLLDGQPVMTGTPLTDAAVPAGQIRSCVFSPGLNATIALGIIEARFAFPGTSLRAEDETATVVAKPFYRRRHTEHG
jgi:aminomethyltransferase